jgi:hypothetical protein
MPSTTDHEEEDIVDASVKDGNMSKPEQVNRPNPWRKMMMMMTIILPSMPRSSKWYIFLRFKV